MNLATIKTFIAAVIFCVILFFGIFYVSNILYEKEKLEDSAFPLGQEFENEVTSPKNKTDDEALRVVTLEERLKNADSIRGKKFFAKCAICHNAVKNGKNRIGPNLYAIVGRPFAAIENYHYSKAMLEKANQAGDKIWDLSNLDAFLTSPRQYIKGTIMTFEGMDNAQNRADLLLYLQSLND